MPKFDIKTEQGTVTIELERPPTPDDIPMIQKHVDQFFLQQAHQRNIEAGEVAEQRVQNVATAGNVIGAGLRVGGMFAGPAGAALAEPAAELVEQAGGGGEGLSLRTIPRAALSAGLAAVPGNWFGQPSGLTKVGAALRKTVAGATEGAITGGLASTLSPIIEGEAPTPEGIGTGMLTGATMGGVVQGMRTRPTSEILPQSVKEIGKALNIKTRKQFESLTAALPEIHAEALNKGDNFRKLGLAGFGERAHNAAERIWNTNLTPLLAKWGGQKVDLSSVAPAMRGDISTMTLEAEPSVAAGLAKARAFYSQSRSLSEIQGRIKDLNKEIKAGSAQTKAKRIDLLGDPHYGPKIREVDALKNIFADKLGQVSGVDVKDIKGRYYTLQSIGDLADQADQATFAKIQKEQGAKAPLLRGTGPGLESALNLKIGTAAKHLGKAIVPKGIREAYAARDPNAPDNLITSALIRLGNRYHNKTIGIVPTQQPLALPPAPSNISGETYNIDRPLGGPTGNVNPPYPARAALPPYIGEGTIQPTSGQKITPSAIPGPSYYPSTKIPVQERNLISQELANEPIKPQYDIDLADYLNLMNVSKKAQEFLGVKSKPSKIPPPPKE